jgi:hypothetical protein
MFALGSGDSIQLTHDPAKVTLKQGQKTLLIVKTDPPGPGPEGKETHTGLGSRIVFMEFTKPILESLHNNCSVSALYTTSYASLHFLSPCWEGGESHIGCSKPIPVFEVQFLKGRINSN